jgi:phage major head subunit gpT-like protein
VINPAQLNIFMTNASTLIGSVYGMSAADSVYKRITSEYPFGEALTLLLGWTGKLVKPRTWEGPRVVTEPAPETYAVNCMPYEHTVAIDRFRLMDCGGNFGIYYRTLQDQIEELNRMPDYWTRDLIEGLGSYASTSGTGNRQLGYDGLTHWNSAHPVDVYNAALGTYCNDFGTAGVVLNGITVGGLFSPTAFATLCEYTPTIKGQDNEPLNIRIDTLMHPPQLRTEVELVLKSTFFAPPAWGTITGQVGAADNVFKRFGVEPLENTFLTSATGWYGLCTKKSYMPFMWGPREPASITPMVAPNTPNNFANHQLLWGGEGRAAAFWGYEFLSFRSGR